VAEEVSRPLLQEEARAVYVNLVAWATPAYDTGPNVDWPETW